MASEAEAVLEKFRQDFQKILVRYTEYWTSNDTRAIERALQELAHVERKIKSVEEKRKLPA